MNIFELFGTIAINNEQANKALADTGKQANGLSNTMEAAFNKMQGAARKIGTAIATAFAADRIKDFGQTCAEVFASVAAEESAFAQIMGDYATMATEKMNQVADSTGVVSTRLTPYMTSMTAKFKGLGYEVDEATSLAAEGLTIASDAAAFWDKSLDESMSHLNSFINGSYEGGEAIGLFANDTQMAAYAVEKGLVKETKAWSKLDEATKQATRLRYAKEMMAKSGATGQAAIEAENYANVQANLNEQFRQFQAVIGEPIMNNIMLPAMRRLSNMMPGITDKTGQFVQTFTTGLNKAATYFSSDFDPAAMLKAFGTMISNAVKAVPGKLEQFGQTISTTWTNSVWPTVRQHFQGKLDIQLPDFEGLADTFDIDWKKFVLPTLTGFLTGNWLTITPLIGMGLAGLITSNWDTHIAPVLDGFLNQVLTIQPPDFTAFKQLFTTEFAVSAQELFSELGGKLSEALGTGGETLALVLGGVKEFGTWCAENKNTISEFFATMGGEAGDGMLAAGELLTIAADAIKGLAEIGVETVTGGLQWILSNGEKTALILEALAVGFATAAIAAHPYAAAIVAAAAALGLMKEYGGKDRYDHFFDAYSDEDLAKLQKYVDAMNEYNAALKAQDDALDAGIDTENTDEAVRVAKERVEAALAEADAVEGLIGTYNSWNKGQDGYKEGMYFDIPVRTSEDSEAIIQGELDSMAFESDVSMNADTSPIWSQLRNAGFSAYATIYPSISSFFGGITGKVDGSHATGLDFVPRDNYLARLHKGEAVLTSSQADAWRSGSMGGSDVGRLETAINNLAGMMQQMVNNTAGGKQIVLDSGVLVGQLAPALDTQLGTISSRKGRRN